jgi:hypothetical protein
MTWEKGKSLKALEHPVNVAMEVAIALATAVPTAAASSVANVVPKGFATAAAVAKASAVTEAVGSSIVALVATNIDADKNWPVNDNVQCFCKCTEVLRIALDPKLSRKYF